MLSGGPATGATLTWSGGAGDNNISTAGNWSPVQSPVAGDVFIFAGSAGLAPSLGTSLSIASITFNSTASAFTLGGTGTYTLSSGVTNSSTSTETINNAITLAAAQTWSATSGALVFGGNINNGGFLLTISGGFGTTIGGIISGSGGLTKSSASTATLTLNGTNTYTGATTLSGTSGTVAIGNNAAFGTSAVTFGGAIIQTSGGARTIANNISITANTTFTNANDLTINGIFSMTASRTFTFSGAGIVTLGGVVTQASGSRKFTKSGTGTLVLNGANTFAGGLLVNAGTVIFGNNAAAGTSTLQLSAATIQAGGAARTLTNAVSIIGNTTFSGSNDLTFSGATAMTASRTLTVNSINTTFSGVLSGSTFSLTKNGTGILTLSGASANTFSGSTIVNDGSLIFNKAAGVNAMGGTVLTVGDATGAAGSAVVQLNAANQIPDAANLTVNLDGQLNLQGFIDAIGTLTMNGGSVTGTGTSRLDLGGDITTSATGSNVASITANVGLNASRTFTINDNSVTTDTDLSISGIISGATFFITKAGAGTLALSGVNTYSGGTNVNAGTLFIDNSAALGTGTVNVGDTTGTSAASLLFSATAGRTVTNALTVRTGSSGTAKLGGMNTSGTNTFSGNVTLNKSVTLTAESGGIVDFTGILSGATFGVTKIGAGTVRLSNVNTYTGLTTINAGTLSYSVSNAIATGAVTIDGSTAVLDLGASHTDSVGTVILDNGGTITGSGTSALTSTATYDVRNGSVAIPLSGSVALTKTTSGTVTLSAANSYTLATTVSAGTLRLGTASSIPSTSAVTVTGGATLDANGFNQTIGSLAGAGAVTLGTATLNAGSDNTTTTFSGIISGSGGLTKAGSGVFTLSGSSTYTGATTISAGTLKLGVATGITSTSAVTATGTFDLNNFSATIGSLTGAGNVTLGSGTLSQGGNNSSTTFSGVISGTGGLAKDGTGTFRLNGTNTFTGAVAINTGTLTLSGASGRAASASGFTIGTGATLTLDNSSTEHADRIGNSAGIAFGGGTLNFISDSNGTTETVGALSATGGASSVNVTHSGIATDITSLTFSSLGTIAAGATVNFSATGGTLGSATTGPHIFITGQASGLLGGWATVGSDFAEYFNFGVRAFSSYYSGADGINVNDTTKIVLLSSTSPSTAYTLTNAGTTTDLNLSLTDIATVDLGSLATRTLNLSSGGLLKSSATATTISGTGRLTAGGTAAGTLAVTVDADHTLTISASIIDNAGTNGIYGDAGDGIVSLSKGDAGLLILSGTNTFTGTVVINGGTLQVSAENNLGAAANDIYFGGGTLSITTGFTTSSGKVLTVNADQSGTLNIATSQTLTLSNTSGTLATGNTASVLHKAGAGTLILQAANAAFDGIMQLDAGILELRNAQALGDAVNRGRITLNGGTLKLINDSSTSFANDVTATADSSIDLQRLTGTTPAVAHTLGTLSIGASTLTFTGANGSALTTGSVVLTGAATFSPSTADATLGAVSGAFGLTKTGAATLILNGTGTYTGSTTVSVGTLKLGLAGGVTSTSAVSIASGATFDLNNLSTTVASITGAGSITLGSGTLTAGGDNSTTTFSGVINGSGGLTKSGSGVLTLSGSNTYTGMTTINDGTLRLGSVGGVPASSALSVSIASGATFDLNSFNSSIGSLTGVGNVTLGSSTLTSGGDNSSTTFSGVLSGSGSLTKIGSGSFTLSGASTYTGTTTVSAGIVVVQSSSALGAVVGGCSVITGAELRLTSGTAVGVKSLTLSGAGVAGAGALHALSGSTSWAGPVTLAAAATIGSDAGQLTLGGAISAGTNTLTFTGAGTIRVDGTIGGSNAVEKSGTGTLILTAPNTYSGTTTISTGTVQVQNGAALGTGSTSVINGAAIVFNNPSGISSGLNPLTVSGSGISGAGVIDSVIGSQSWAGDITLALDATFAVEADSLTLAGAIGESGSPRALTKTGAGTLVFGGSNAYTGATQINAGTLTTASSQRIADSSAVSIAAGALLDLNDNDETIGSLAGAGTVDLGTLATASLTTGGDNTSTTFSGVISGSGDLIKPGSGTLTMSGVNTFSGTVYVNGGVFSISADSALGSSTNALDFGGGTLRLTAALTLSRVVNLSTSSTVDTSGLTSTIGSVILGSGTFTKAGAGTLNFTAVNTYTGSTTVSAGTLNISATAELASSSISVITGTVLSVTSGGLLSASTALNTNGSVILNGGAVTIDSLSGTSSGVLTLNSTILTLGSGSFAGVIQNGASAGKITKTGAGTLTLSGTNTYTNGTILNGGILALGSAGALGTSGTLTFSGGTLQHSASNTTDYSARFSTAASQAYSIDTSGQNVTYATALTSSGGSLTKFGAGRLTLTGLNTYSGVTTVTAGTLQVGAAGSGRTGAGATIVGDATNPATLAGTGTVNGTANSTNHIVKSSATLTPGDNDGAANGGLTFTGNLNLNNNSQTLLQLTTRTTTAGNFGGNAIGSAGYQSFIAANVATWNSAATGNHDWLSINGALTLGTNTAGLIQVQDNGYVSSAQSGDVFDLLDWSSITLGSFNAGTNFRSGGLGGGDLLLPDLSLRSLFWDVSQFNSSGILIVVVPEPSRAMLLLLGLLALPLHRRRRQPLPSP